MENEINMNEFGKNLPEKKFSTGAITATVWRNERKVDGKDTEFQSVSLQRSYKDKEGNWKTTSAMRPNDIPKAVLVLEKAYEYIVLKEGAE